jgi:hypothetical protein
MKLLCSFLQPLISYFLLDANILFSILFSNSFNLCFPLNVRDQISQPYKTTGKVEEFTYRVQFKFTSQNNFR